MKLSITWLGHASMRYEAKRVVYVDPWEVKETHDADVVLVTHDHYDHCVPEDIARVAKKGTVVAAPADCAAKIVKISSFTAISPGDKMEVNGVPVEAVAAYNQNKKFHPKANNWVGYIFQLGGRRIYQAGDTDKIDEMKQIKTDIAVLPIGGTYTMTAAEAAEAAILIKPRLCIPMHYAKIVGADTDAENFAQLMQSKCKVVILPRQQKTIIEL